MQHHAQCVHIGGHAQRTAAKLLGRGVLGRHSKRAFAGELRVGALVQQLGDAEIQQLDRALAVHQDVGRLQIAVDGQLAVCRAHRGQHLQEQADAGMQGQPCHIAPSVDALALHPFQHQVGLALRREAGIEQLRDAWVAQPRQQGALAPKALLHDRVAPPGLEELDGRVALVAAVMAPCAPDLAHAALAHGLVQGQGAHAVAGFQALAQGLRIGHAVQEAGLLRRLVGLQQRPQLHSRVRIALCQGLQAHLALGAGQRQELVQQRRKHWPAGGIEGQHGGGVPSEHRLQGIAPCASVCRGSENLCRFSQSAPNRHLTDQRLRSDFCDGHGAGVSEIVRSSYRTRSQPERTVVDASNNWLSSRMHKPTRHP